MMDVLHSIVHVLDLAVGWIFSASWLPPGDFKFYRWLIVPGYGYGFVLITFGIAELLRPAQPRPWSRRTLLSGTYLLFAGKIGIYAIVVVPAMRKAWLALGLPSVHLDQVLPWPAYMLVAVLVITFTGYWAHRLMHQVPIFWHIHKIHHSAENLNAGAIYHMHFLELLLHTPMHMITVLLLGTNLVAPFGIIWKVIDVLGHANVRLDLGRLAYLVSTPQAHRIHHSIEPRHYNSNYGNTFMIWDHVFGTFQYNPADLPTKYGVDDQVPVGFVKQQVLPLVWIARDVKRRLAARVRRPVGSPVAGD